MAFMPFLLGNPYFFFFKKLLPKIVNSTSVLNLEVEHRFTRLQNKR